jgi:four helix bundle protein
MAKYEDLRVWRYSHELASKVRRITWAFPREERFELASQLRRAALSVPTNLVEGSGLRGPRPFLRHVRIAIGSLREVEYLLRVARDDGYISESSSEALGKEVEVVRVMLHSLAKALERAQK